jgi:predicted transcriptional regulator
MFDLKRFRKDKKLGQKDIVPILNVGQAFISQVEKGKDPMPDGWINILKEKYQVENIEQYITEDIVSTDSDCMKQLNEKLMRGEVFPAIVVKQKDDLIESLYDQISELKAEIKRLGGESIPQKPVKERKQREAG